jgi:hypothetical protein
MKMSFTLGKNEIDEAIRDYVRAKFPHADGPGIDLSVSLTHTPGDRPFDPDCWTATVSQRNLPAGKD